MQKDKHGVDFSKLEHRLFTKAYRLKDVQHRLERVGFDIVRFKDGDEGSKLWQVQSAEDGDYIVVLYEDVPEEKTASHWEVCLSKTAKDLNFFYKGEPIVKMAASTLGIPDNELPSVPRYLPAKLTGNKALVKALLNQLDPTTKNAVLVRYPELA
jgi:hypothetical protein